MTRGRPILTAQAMRAAEQAAIAGGTSVESLMERAGAALAEAVFRFAGPMPALVLAGPGNNGGDGYVAARILAERGVQVRVAALAQPGADAAKKARGQWPGEVETLTDATPSAPLLIDALFGTGLKRGLKDAAHKEFSRLCDAALLRVACDLPSGVDSDSGAELSAVPRFDLTVTFGALKPAHRLFPAMHKCGRVVLADIGVVAEAGWHEIAPPELPRLAPGGHKYDRGYVLLVAGEMPGAIALSATAAANSGAGYVKLISDTFVSNVPRSVVQGHSSKLLWKDKRIDVVLAGPGLGRGRKADGWLDVIDNSRVPTVLDADALSWLGPNPIDLERSILTPHEGEFDRLFPDLTGPKPERTLVAARTSSATIVYKGPDTLVAAPDGRLGFAPPAPAWLASAGSGDVLAGIIAALRARGLGAFEAASAGVWLHGRAAEIAGPQMIADDLIDALPRAIALIDG